MVVAVSGRVSMYHLVMEGVSEVDWDVILGYNSDVDKKFFFKIYAS